MRIATSENKIIKRKFTQGNAGNVLDANYFYYETAPNYNKALAVVCGGHEECAPDFEINRTNYPYYFIKCTIKGKGVLEINDQCHEIKPGTVTGFTPKTAHHFTADPQNPMEHIFITFVGTEAEHLLKASSLFQKSIMEPSNPSETLEIIEKIFAIGFEKKHYSQQICCNYLRILLLQLGQDVGSSEKHFSQSMATYLQCKTYIDSNFSKLSSLQEAADYCCINPRYMSSLFKRYGLNSPHEYIMRLKMSKAAHMLLTSMLSVKEIAYTTGFTDPYHFSRIFKKIHHLSPRDYRNKHM